MNMVEHYILEAFSVETIPHRDWMDCEWVRVSMMVNCYGVREKKEYVNTRKGFERDMERGYYMA